MVEKEAKEVLKRLKSTADFRTGYEDEEEPAVPIHIEQMLVVWALSSSEVLGVRGAKRWEEKMRKEGLFVAEYPVRPPYSAHLVFTLMTPYRSIAL
jgi:hypothetical protein